MLSKWEALPFKISLTHAFWQLSFSVKSFLLLEIGKNKERQQKKKNKSFHNQSNIILLKLFLYNDFSILVILKKIIRRGSARYHVMLIKCILLTANHNYYQQSPSPNRAQ